MVKIKLLTKTDTKDLMNSDSTDLIISTENRNDNEIDAADLNNPNNLNDLLVLSGMFGGTCYAADGYETIKHQPIEKAINRAKMTAKAGHHTVFGHCMVTMEITCSKIIAMLLNSIGVSNTSEKSARYTKMEPETKLEKDLYSKWHNIFVKLITEKYPDKFSEKETDKLAYENARYMISVFTPTSMVYSIPYRNLFYIVDWGNDMMVNLKKISTTTSSTMKTAETIKTTKTFNERLYVELENLVSEIKKIIGTLPKGFSYLTDNKHDGFKFMPYQAKKETLDEKEYYGNVYTSKYLASFAALAQIQRHRTIDVRINFLGHDAAEYGFYIPPILLRTEYKDEWIEDMRKVKDIYPQGTLVEVYEQGLFERFVDKCKERMCGRAQLETMKIVESQIYSFVLNEENLSKANQKILKTMTSNQKGGLFRTACARCKYPDFKCSEGCKWGANGAITRLI